MIPCFSSYLKGLRTLIYLLFSIDRYFFGALAIDKYYLVRSLIYWIPDVGDIVSLRFCPNLDGWVGIKIYAITCLAGRELAYYKELLV